MTQTTLPYVSESPAQRCAVELEAALRGRGWVTRRDLFRTSPCVWHERLYRAAAEASDGRILGGQRGYCRIEEATLDDIIAVENGHLSQGRKHIRHALRIRKRRASLVSTR